MNQSIEDIYELSAMQRAMLLHALSAPASTAYFNQFSCRLSGALNPALLEQAWQTLVARHAVLRASFHWEGLDKPVQVVRREAALPWSFADWRGVDDDEQTRCWQEHLASDRKAGFRLDQAPLMRCRLVQVSDSQYLFSWSHHHLLLDGWCLSIVLEELFQLYAGEARGQAAKLKAVRPFRDYILWLQQRDRSSAEAFWKSYLAGFGVPTTLPWGRAGSAASPTTTVADETVAEELSEHFTDQLRWFAAQHQLTLNTLVQGAWALLLSRYGGESDIVFGVTVSGRPPELEGVEEMLGVFINTLPVRVLVDADAELITWLKHNQSQQSERSPHEHAALPDIHEWSEAPRGTPLFESNIIVMNYTRDHSSKRAADGFEIEDAIIYDRTDVPLTLQVTPGNRLELELLYASNLFDTGGVKRMIGHLRTLLEGWVDDPHRRLSSFPILTEEENLLLLTGFNNTRKEFDREQTFIHRFEKIATTQAERVAVEFEGERTTFGELNTHANQLARCLLKRAPLQSDDLIAVLLKRSPRMMESILAVWKCGAAYVPVDADYPAERIRTVLRDSRAKLVLTTTGLIPNGLEDAAQFVLLDEIEDERERENHSNLNRVVRHDDLAYVFYTSGSTGKPKGAMVEHVGMLNHMLAKIEDFELGAQSVVAQNASHCFDISVWQFFAAPLAGGRTNIYRDDVILNPDVFIRRVETDGVTVLEVVPSYLSALLERVATGAGLFSRLKYLAVTGEVVKPALIDRWFRVFVDVPVINAYGPTEASDDITHYRMERPPAMQSIPVGKPLRNFHIYVVDEFMNLCPVGIKGEVCVSGVGVGRGYLYDEERTRTAFIEDPFRREAGVRMYRTGDEGCFMLDGNLLLSGRKDYQIKVRGHRIEPGEIESLLTELPPVQDAVVLHRQDDGRDPYLCAYVQLDEGARATAEWLSQMLSERVPEYMIPAAFVLLDRLPLNTNGKIDRKALPAPDRNGQSRKHDYAGPRTPLEETLCHIWSESLGIDRPGINDNFFALGGDSIISMQIVSRAARAGWRLTPAQIFERQTIAELSRVAQPIKSRTTTPSPVTGSLPLTPIQRRFFARNKAAQEWYNQSLLLEAPLRLDASRLAQALAAIVDHHDALRLRFRFLDEAWRQEIALPGVEVPLHVEDLSGLVVSERQDVLEKRATALHAGLDLADGPLFRVGLFKFGDAAPTRLLFVVHHLAIDAVSWRVLIEDVHDAYTQLERGERVVLTEKSTSYQDWAQALAGYAASEVALNDLDFWLAQSSSDDCGVPLDYQADAESNLVASARELTVSLSKPVTRALLQDTARAYNTQINDLLLAALALAFNDRTGAPNILVDVEGHGREDLIGDVDVSRSVGWFTALFPVRLEVDGSGAEKPGRTIKSVKERLRRIPSRGISYGALRYLSEDESVRRRLSAMPGAQVLFNYLGQTDQGVSSGGREWMPVAESSGSGRSPQQMRDHLLEVNAYVAGGQLHVVWSYSHNFHNESTVRGLAEGYREHLEALIAHCAGTRADGFTPSDFPAARLSQDSLDALALRFQDIEDIYELTPTQQGMLFHSLYEPDSGAYFNQLTCRLDGTLDPELFRRAWQLTLDRHAILRASFHWQGLEKPVQLIRRGVRLPWHDEDLSDSSADHQAHVWQKHRQDDRSLGFNLETSPLMRLSLFRTGVESWRVQWTQHHLLLDGWSSSLILNEVLEVYAALRTGEQLELSPPRSFRSAVQWLQRQNTGEAERFWKRTLAGFRTPTPLVLGVPEMAGDNTLSAGDAEEEMSLCDATSDGLFAMAHENGITLNTLAQGAWALLLSRYGGGRDVVYGTIFSGRPAALEGADEMVGVFINTLPVRIALDPDTLLMSWLKHLQTGLLEIDAYAYCSLADIQSWSDVSGGTPLFESILIFENYPVRDTLKQSVSGLHIGEVSAFEPNNYPLTLVVTPGPRLSLKVMYSRERFDQQTILRLLGHYRTILKSYLDAPHQTLSAVTMLTEAERKQLLCEWNETATPSPLDRTLIELFEERVASHPERTAVQCGNVAHSYRELSERSGRLARHILSVAEVRPDDRIAIVLTRSEKMLESILAVWKCGAAYVPLEPKYPAGRIGAILADARPRMLITDSGTLRAGLAAAISPDVPVVCLDRLEHRGDETAGAPLCRPESLAYVIYTSGSTGKPKGAMVEHRGMLNHVLGMVRDLEIDAGSTVAQTASHCFDISVWQFFAALVSGSRTVIYSDEIVLRPARLATQLDEDGVAIVQFVPSYLTALLDELENRDTEKLFSKLRWMVLIGETLKPVSVRRWFRLFPGVRMMNAYGPTEASDSITHYVIERPPRLASIPVGRPVQNLRVYIVDADMNLCPVGVKGEICVAGVGVGRGYIFDEERTRAVFAEDPFQQARGVRLYHTGDIGCYAPDGNILFFGRKDFQVKIRGHRIELGEVESALAALDGISDAVVVAHEEEGGKYLCAYITLSGHAVRDERAVRDALREQLPGHMIPEAFVILDELPLTPNGKVDRKALPLPGATRSTDFAPPTTPFEESLVGIWQAVLGRERVGIDDGFFELGGHSLRAIQMVSRIRSDLNVEANLADVLSLDTIRALAAHLEQVTLPGASVREEIKPIAEQTWYEVSHTQRRIWLASRTAEGSIAHNMAGAFLLDGILDRRALKRALDTVVERHESLRTVYAIVEGELRQKIRNAAESGFQLEELDRRDDAEAALQVPVLAAEEAARPFDLVNGSLFRAKLVRLEDEKYLLLLTIHHIAGDAWSIAVLVGDLSTLYAAFREGHENPLPPLTIQYRDYAAWHNALLKSGEMNAHREYWLRKLAGEIPRLSLPADLPRPVHPTYAGGRIDFQLEQSHTRELSALALRHNASLHGIVLASIFALLHRYTGEADIAIGSQNAGREHHRLEDQVGAYLNTVVLRCRVEGRNSIGEVIAATRLMLREATRHQAYPFDLLLEERRVRTSSKGAPLFDVQADYVPRFRTHDESLDGLMLTDVSTDAGRSKYDLSFLFQENDTGILQVSIVYNSDLFRRATLDTMRERLLEIQRAFARDDRVRIDDIRLDKEIVHRDRKPVRVSLRL